MTQRQAARQFKKHWKYASSLKEGGAAWEREMAICEKYLKIGTAKHQQALRERYGA